MLFEEALANADAKDKDRQAGLREEDMGPFWGIPGSFKGKELTSQADEDTYHIAGVDSSIGCSPYVSSRQNVQLIRQPHLCEWCMAVQNCRGSPLC